MSTSTPLVSHHEHGLGPDGISLEESNKSCGKSRYKRLCITLVALVFLGGIGVLIWQTVRSKGHSSDGLRSFNLNSMFNRTLSPARASVAWIEGVQASGQAPQDQFLSRINGSFYLYTMPDWNTPQLLISQEDLQPFAEEFTPAKKQQATPTGTGHYSRRLMGQDNELFSQEPGTMPDAENLHAELQQSNRRAPPGRSSEPARMLRPRPNHAMRLLADSEQVEAFHGEQPMHLQSAQAHAAPEAAAASFVYSSYDLSPDLASMLFAVNCTQLYRHSSFCSYLVYDINAKTMTPLAAGKSLRLASWSPTSSMIAYVLDNNIYVWNKADQQVTQVTTDGKWDEMINGVYDWVYEEEIAQATAALWWSPDGTAFAFLKSNETRVPKFEMDYYRAPYNLEFAYKYPLPGYPNSIVDIDMYNVTTGEHHTFDSLRAVHDYEYIINVLFANPTELLLRVENREQNQWQLLKLSVQQDTEVITKLSAATAPQYHEPHAVLTSLYPLPYYIDLVFDEVDNQHLALFSVVDGSLVRFLTGGSYDVLGLNAVTIVQAQTARVYYTREIIQTDAKIAVPTVWSVSIDTTTNGTADSNQLVTYDTERYTWQAGSFSASGSYFVLQENAVVPTSTLYSVSFAGEAQVLTVLADNSKLVAAVKEEYRMPNYYYTEIDSSLPGLKLSVSVQMPRGQSLSDCKKRRVLINAYGGPGSQSVTTSYPISFGGQGSFHAGLSSSHDFIVVIVDPVGTKGKGESYRKEHTYLRLGLQEREDLLTATKWIKSQCWADDEISYWGWSYGGFMTSFVASAGSGLYTNLISVAPVTSWLLYDNVYTERYMLTPQQNPEGYFNTSVIQQASSRFDADVWHLYAGTADDNVHAQHSFLLVDALINLDLPLNTFFFPNRAHSLTQWLTGAPPRYLYEMLIKLLTGTGGPSGQKKQ